MGNAVTEAPASYVLASQFHDQVQTMIEEMDHEHDYLAIELLKYSERIVGNVGAAEAPFAVGRRQFHYQMAFAAICGCASACDLVRKLKLAPKENAEAAVHALTSLASIVRPIAEEGMDPRGEMEAAILDDIFDSLESDEPWKDEDDDDEAW